MSRARIGYALACLGILITTGGCGSSATAPEAASIEASANRFNNPTTADDGAANPVTPAAPGTSTEDEFSTTSSGHIAGGGRAEP
jgi:hypothetical protein